VKAIESSKQKQESAHQMLACNWERTTGCSGGARIRKGRSQDEAAIHEHRQPNEEPNGQRTADFIRSSYQKMMFKITNTMATITAQKTGRWRSETLSSCGIAVRP